MVSASISSPIVGVATKKSGSPSRLVLPGLRLCGVNQGRVHGSFAYPPPSACSSILCIFPGSLQCIADTCPGGLSQQRSSCTVSPGEGRMVRESLLSKGWVSGFCRINTAFPVTPSEQLSRLPTNKCGAHM